MHFSTLELFFMKMKLTASDSMSEVLDVVGEPRALLEIEIDVVFA